MKLQEILVFGSLIVIVGILFYTSGGNLGKLDELPSEFDGKNSIFESLYNQLFTPDNLFKSCHEARNFRFCPFSMDNSFF